MRHASHKTCEKPERREGKNAVPALTRRDLHSGGGTQETPPLVASTKDTNGEGLGEDPLASGNALATTF